MTKIERLRSYATKLRAAAGGRYVRTSEHLGQAHVQIGIYAGIVGDAEHIPLITLYPEPARQLAREILAAADAAEEGSKRS